MSYTGFNPLIPAAILALVVVLLVLAVLGRHNRT
jgi:hypothetical protein